jgi:hypothetical protein
MLQAAFEPYGPSEVKVIMDRDDEEKSRGFAFVTFTSVDAATRAIHEMNDSELDGKSHPTCDALAPALLLFFDGMFCQCVWCFCQRERGASVNVSAVLLST